MKRQRWEYALFRREVPVPVNDRHDAAVEEWMNELGEEGWEIFEIKGSDRNDPMLMLLICKREK
jgi:hypothetical protein